MSREAQSQLPASGMAHHHHPLRARVVSSGLLPNVSICGADVGERPRPSAAFVADATILQIKRGETGFAQSVAQVSGMSEIIFRAPKAAVQIQQNRVNTLPRRKTNLDKLRGIATVGLALIGWRRRLSEDVFG
jgi:hypothetical protein